jgi:DNA mismatch endonuclease, patch repair protein
MKAPLRELKSATSRIKKLSEQRSRIMRAVRSRDTQPEITVRRLLHSLGHRFRLHARNIVGNPDIVNRRRKFAIFVHGCFWHGHFCVRGNRIPKNNREYWIKKIERNKERDVEQRSKLLDLRWSVLTIWECEIGNADLLKRLDSFWRFGSDATCATESAPGDAAPPMSVDKSRDKVVSPPKLATASVEIEGWHVSHIQEALNEARTGVPGVLHEDVVRWIDSSDTEHELHRPTPREP